MAQAVQPRRRCVTKFLLCLLALVIPSLSTADVIGVYSDAVTGHCSINDTPGPQTLYVIHRFSLGSVGASLRIEYSSGFTGTMLGSSSPFTNVTGDPLSGITVMYDNVCQSGTFHILTLSFMLYGGSPDCSWVRVAPDPLACGCDFTWAPAYWEGTHVDPGYGGADCPNDIDYEEHTHFCRPYYEPTVRTESLTWGAVKALYR